MIAAALIAFYDVAPEHRAEHEAWYLGEHLPERVALPGFVRGRRYVAEPGAALPRLLTIFETTSLAALSSPAYLARLQAPTPGTRRLAPQALGARRTACELAARAGDPGGVGGHLCAAWLRPAQPASVSASASALAAVLADALGDEGPVTGATLWRPAPEVSARKDATTEAALAPAAVAPAWTLLVEGGGDVASAAARLLDALAACGLHGEGPPSRYRLSGALTAG